VQVTGPYTWVRAFLPGGFGSYDMSVFKVRICIYNRTAGRNVSSAHLSEIKEVSSAARAHYTYTAYLLRLASFLQIAWQVPLQREWQVPLQLSAAA
jgi:hypothetical protein